MMTFFAAINGNGKKSGAAAAAAASSGNRRRRFYMNFSCDPSCLSLSFITAKRTLSTLSLTPSITPHISAQFSVHTRARAPLSAKDGPAGQNISLPLEHAHSPRPIPTTNSHDVADARLGERHAGSAAAW